MGKANAIVTPDFRSYSMYPGVVAARVEGNWVRVRWADGEQGRFHTIWLRDNAADPRSIDPHSHERIFTLLDLPADIAPVRVGADGNGALAVEWGEDGFVSRYHPGWLRSYCYDLGARAALSVPYVTWDGSFAASLPRYQFEEIRRSISHRLDWLTSLRRHGIAMLVDGPADRQAYIDWLESVLIVRDMNWGKYFDVIYQEEGEYISNKGLAITPHQDAPTREYMPGIQIFRCVENTVSGGDSFWVDTFHIAEILRRDHPDHFRLLSTVPWEHANRNMASEYHADGPIIVVEPDGRFKEVRDTYWLREPLRADFDLIEPMYAAYRRFTELAHDPVNQVRHRLAPGEIAMIDNRRIMHARAAYDRGAGRRHMMLCLSEREEVDSAIAVLRRLAE